MECSGGSLLRPTRGNKFQTKRVSASIRKSVVEMGKLIAKAMLLASLLVNAKCTTSPQHFGTVNNWHSLRLRGGSVVVEGCSRQESLPNPRLYQPPAREILTHIQYCPEPTEEKQDINNVEVLGSWSNWELHEPMSKNAETGVWELTKPLSPGEYKVSLFDCMHTSPFNDQCDPDDR